LYTHDTSRCKVSWVYIQPKTFTVAPNYFGFSKNNNHKDFLKKFNLSMKKARAAGVFKAIS